MPDYVQRVENLYRDEDIRVLHSLSSPPYYTLSMDASDQSSQYGGFSNTSVTNSTLVYAGSPIASSTIDSDDASNRGFGLRPMESVRSFKKEEVESKITAWRNAKIAEINNRFKCEDAIINGWEAEQAQQSSLRMKKVERKLEEKRVRAMEKMENEIAKARKKAEERRATAEAKRGTKIARVVEVANLMKAIGRSPVKRSFFRTS